MRPATVTPAGQPEGAGRRILERVPGKAELDPRRYVVRRQRMERSLGWAVPALFLLSWQLASVVGILDARFFPAPSTVIVTGVELVSSGELQTHLAGSLMRVVSGFVLGACLGLTMGVLLGLFRTVRAAFEPLLSGLYTVPKLALLPLLLLIFGLGDTPKILLIGITTFFFVWIATQGAVSSVEEGYREAARSFQVSGWQMFRHVILPASLPQIFTGLRIAVGVSILVMVGAEFVQGNNGIGYLIWNSWRLFIARRMYVGIMVVAIMGVIAMLLVKAIGRRLTPWTSDDPRTTTRGAL